MGFLDKPGFGGLVSAGGGLLGSVVNNYAQYRLAQWQNQQNLKMWNLQNEYNSPAAQMQRFKDAGLNPNLIYGNGSASAGNATSAPGVVAPNLRSDLNDVINNSLSNYLAHLSAFQDIKKSNQEIKESVARENVANENAKYIAQNTLNAKMDHFLKSQQKLKNALEYRTASALAPYQISQQRGILRAQFLDLLNGIADLRAKNQIYNHHEVMNPLLQDQLRYDIVPKRYRADIISRLGYDPGLNTYQGFLSQVGGFGLPALGGKVKEGYNRVNNFFHKVDAWFVDRWNNMKPDKNVYHPY